MNGRIPFDRSLILVVLVLVGFGLVMVFSSTAIGSGDLTVFIRHLAFTLTGLVLMVGTMHINYHFYARWIVLLPMVVVAAILLIWALLSPEVNGAHRWISFAGFRGQPSELAKVVMILFTSAYIVSYRDRLNQWQHGLLPYTAVAGTILLLILLEPDFGTAACLTLVCGVLLFLAGVHLRYFGLAALAAVPAFYLLIYAVPYRRDRVLAFLYPELDPLGIGYQVRQSLIAVGSGGFSGLGFAQSRQKLAFLPEANTDFVFSIVGEELGLIGTLLVVTLFMLLFWRGIKIALRADTQLGAFIGFGIVAMIVLQAMINMSVAVSLLPTKGIPLPFISVGGSSMLTTLAAVGILLNISRYGGVPGRLSWLHNTGRRN